MHLIVDEFPRVHCLTYPAAVVGIVFCDDNLMFALSMGVGLWLAAIELTAVGVSP